MLELITTIGFILGAQGGMSPEEVLTRSHEHALSLQAASLRATKSRRRSNTRWLGYVPRIDAEASYTRLSDVELPSLFPPEVAQSFGIPEGEGGFPVFLDNYSARVTMVVPLSDYLFSLPKSLKNTKAAADMEALQLEQLREQVGGQSLDAYLQVISARQSLKVAEISADVIKGRAEDFRRLARVGNVTKADLAAIEARAAAVDAQVIRARSAVKVAEARLRHFLGMAPDEALVIGEDAKDWSIQPVGPFGPNEGLAQASEARADLQAASMLEGFYTREARKRLVGTMPSLIVGGDITHANPNQRIIPNVDQFDTTWAAYAALRWSPNDAITNMTLRREGKSDAEAAKADRDALLQAIELQVTAASDGVQAAGLALEAAKKQADAAERAFKDSQRLQELGDVTVQTLLEREQSYREAQQALISAEVQAQSAMIDWLLATGGLLEHFGMES